MPDIRSKRNTRWLLPWLALSLLLSLAASSVVDLEAALIELQGRIRQQQAEERSC